MDGCVFLTCFISVFPTIRFYSLINSTKRAVVYIFRINKIDVSIINIRNHQIGVYILRWIWDMVIKRPSSPKPCSIQQYDACKL